MLYQNYEITPKAQGFSKPSFVQESMEFLLNKSLIQKTRSSASTNNPIPLTLTNCRVDPKETLKEFKKLLKSSPHLVDQFYDNAKFRGLKDERRGISSRQGCRSPHQTITTTQRKEF